jgi:hypothetical protein
VLSFDLSGNQRGGASDTVQVFFGDALTPTLLDTITLEPSAPFTTYSYNVTGPGHIIFNHEGGDNLGLILDNVRLATQAAAVPEPGTLALIGGGLAALELLLLRRRAS